MNKLSLLAVTLLLFIACKKNANMGSNTMLSTKDYSTNMSTTNLTPNFYYLVTSLNDYDAQKAAYNSLTNNEKSLFWEQKIDYAISINNYTENQLSLLHNLRTIANPSIFINESAENIIAKTVTINDWITAAEQEFNELEIRNIGMTFRYMSVNEIFTNLQNGTYEPCGAPKGAGPQLSLCFCNKGSKYTCGRASGLSTNGIGIEYGVCSGSNCVKDSWGCGFMGIHACDGSDCTYSSGTISVQYPIGPGKGIPTGVIIPLPTPIEL